MLIGLAGKSCSGKNIVGELLSARNMEVMDLDRVAHTVLDSCAEEVSACFGPQTVLEDGHVDRKALGKIVFSDPVKRSALESIVYGKLGEQIKEVLQKSERDVVINGALLYRSGFDAWCSCLVYVDASYEVRLARAKERDGVDGETFMLREASQDDVDYRKVDYRCPVIPFDNGAGMPSDIDIDALLAKIECYRRQR